MKKVLLILGFAAVAVACGKKTENKINDVSNRDSLAVNESDIQIDEIPENCYMETTGKDSLFVRISDNLGTVTGKMHYKNFEKDSSFGHLVGMADGDTLKLEYNFQAEGATSTREIWFLKKDGNLIEGIGEYNETGEQYKDPKLFRFTGGHTLKSADCKSIERKLK
ncbi:hypothetical protein H1R16_01115 [Marnyiella aurantia]|uniref:Lipoprotein n=1 Tax=Marnyiella aurantia TaxID=2758037 RepID=A0A7D7LMQ3_9FLAO|nr:hypothetical protein [Marnyiella aurantia]MBA5245962.1 hypothetical protein [Marnyiella aurantia]QMS98644.1 hypothetical protein H1R16_01115 [Marnyiella aurantia]